MNKKITKKATKITLLSIITFLLASMLVLSCVGIYFKRRKPAETPTIVNPLDFSTSTWDGTTVNNSGWLNGNQLGNRGDKTFTINSAESFVYFVGLVNDESTAEQYGYFKDYTIYLNSNINLNNNSIQSIGKKMANGKSTFQGHFNGAFYTIFNANVVGNGLFGFVNDATIENLGLYNVNINSEEECTGALIGQALDSNIQNISVRLGGVNGNNKVGTLVGNFLSTNGEHFIKNVAIDSTVSNGAGAVVGQISANMSSASAITVQNVYYTQNIKPFQTTTEGDFVTTQDVVYLTDANQITSWGYEPEYDATNNWCDYKARENSTEYDFRFPIQTQFFKALYNGAYLENTITNSKGETINVSSLAEAFDKADAGSQVSIIVEKVFVSEPAVVKNGSTVTLTSDVDTTLTRENSFEDNLIVGATGSNLIIGEQQEGTSTAKITFDGNREYVENNNLTSNALVYAQGESIKIKNNVTFKNNVNNDAGYGGAICVYNVQTPIEDEQNLRIQLSANVENCSSAYYGGGICIIAGASEIGGEYIRNCSTEYKGGNVCIMDTFENQSDRAEQVYFKYGGKTLATPAATVYKYTTTTYYTITNCSGGSASYGAGVYLDKSGATLYLGYSASGSRYDTNVYSNSASSSGGGVDVKSGTLDIRSQKLDVYSNSAKWQGAGIWCESGASITTYNYENLGDVHHNNLTGGNNDSGTGGAGIKLSQASSVYIGGLNIYNNTSPNGEHGAGLCIYTNSTSTSVTITKTTYIYGNTVSGSTSGTRGPQLCVVGTACTVSMSGYCAPNANNKGAVRDYGMYCEKGSIKLNYNSPSKAGYYFAGWTTSSYFSNTSSSNPATWTSGSHTLSTSTTSTPYYAVWYRRLTCYYYTQSTSTTSGTASAYSYCDYDGSITYMYTAAYSGTPTRPSSLSGYAFAGWYMSSSSTSSPGTSISVSSATGSISVSLSAAATYRYFYAVWKRTANIYYYSTTTSSAYATRTSTAYCNTTGSIGSFPAASSVSTPTRSGYTFVGWSTYAFPRSASDVTDTSYLPCSTSTSSSTVDFNFYAIWKRVLTVNFYDASGKFDQNTGEVYCGPTEFINSITVDFPTSNPTRTGYKFWGWSTSETSVQDATSTSYSVSAASSTVNIYASWYRNLNINFYASSSSTLYDTRSGMATCACNASISSISISSNPTNPTRDGYNFSGWHRSQGTALSDPGRSSWTNSTSYSVSAADTYYWCYAVWNKYVYLNFYADSVSSTWMTWEETYTCGTNGSITTQSVSFPSTEPTRDGYWFAGWNLQSAAVSNPGTDSDVGAGRVLLTLNSANSNWYFYAVWKRDAAIYYYTTSLTSTHTEAYTDAYCNVTGTIDSLLCYNINAPTRSGYNFVGWYGSNTATDNPGTTYSTTNPTSFTPTGATSYYYRYAVWRRDLTVNFYAENSSTIYTTSTVGVFCSTTDTIDKTTVADPKGSDVVNAVPNRGSLYGWYRSATPTSNPGTTKTTSTSYEVSAANTTYYCYAIWMRPLLVRYYSTSVTEAYFTKSSADNICNVNSTIDTVTYPDPENPTREGYTFAGWFRSYYTSTDNPGTTITESNVYPVNTEKSITSVYNYAVWKRTVNVNFYATSVDEIYATNSGSAVTNCVGDISSVRVEKPTAPTRDNYSFKGWVRYTSPNSSPSGLGYASPNSLEELTYNILTTDPAVIQYYCYASWGRKVTIYTYTVSTYSKTAKNINYLCSAIGSIDTVNINKTPYCPTPERTGYEFMGWYVSNAKNGTDTPGTEISIAASSSSSFSYSLSVEETFIHCYAVWKKVLPLYYYTTELTPAYTEYQTFTCNVKGLSGKVTGNPQVDTTRDGYELAGWNILKTESANPGTSYSRFTDVTVTDTTEALYYYAVWKKSVTHTIVYNMNGQGTAPANTVRTGEALFNCLLTINKPYATTVGLASSQTVTGFTFQNWNTEADGSGTAYNGAASYSISILKDTTITLYAIWKDTSNPVVERMDYECNKTNGYITGFTVYAYATDNDELKRVMFQVWTEENGQDDLNWGTGVATDYTLNGKTYNYKYVVHFYDHNYEYENYNIYAYAYDRSNNSGSKGISNIQPILNVTVKDTDNSYAVTFGSAMPTIAPALIEGSTFLGYYYGDTKYVNADGTSARDYDITTTVDGHVYPCDATLEARWQINNYTITVRTNNSTYGNISSSGSTEHTKTISVPYGTTVAISGATLTIDGTAFTAVPTAATAESTSYFENWNIANGYVIKGDTTILAVFNSKANTYDVTIVNADSEYGTLSVTKLNVVYGTILTTEDIYSSAIKANAKTSSKLKVGDEVVLATANAATIQYLYEFDHWDVEEGQQVVGNMTITAHFKRSFRQYTVKFIPNDYCDTLTFSKVDVNQSSYYEDENRLYNVDWGTTFNITGEQLILGNTKVVATGKQRVGYTTTFKGFTGFNVTLSENVDNLNGAIVGGNMEIYVDYDVTADVDTKYTTEIYIMGLSGSYPETPTETHVYEGTTDSVINTADLVEDKYIITNGIEFDYAKQGNDVVESVTIAGDGSLVVKVYYKRCQHTLTLIAGEGVESVEGEGTYYYGETVNLKATLKEGFVGLRWNGVERTSITIGTTDYTLTATATESKFTVYIQVNNPEYGSVNVEKIENVPYGSRIYVSGDTFTINGVKVIPTPTESTAEYVYVFREWLDIEASEALKNDRTIQAFFVRNIRSHAVTFDVNNAEFGSIDEASILAPYGSTITTSENTITINGITVTATPSANTNLYRYSFVEWTGIPADNTITGPVTITANFKREYNNFAITYRDMKDVAFTGTHAESYPTVHTYGQDTTLDTPTRDGFKFGGWFLNSNLSGEAVSVLGGEDFTADITLYAKWMVTLTTTVTGAQTGNGWNVVATWTYGGNTVSTTLNASNTSADVVAGSVITINADFVGDAATGNYQMLIITKGSTIEKITYNENDLATSQTLSGTLNTDTTIDLTFKKAYKFDDVVITDNVTATVSVEGTNLPGSGYVIYAADAKLTVKVNTSALNNTSKDFVGFNYSTLVGNTVNTTSVFAEGDTIVRRISDNIYEIDGSSAVVGIQLVIQNRAILTQVYASSSRLTNITLTSEQGFVKVISAEQSYDLYEGEWRISYTPNAEVTDILAELQNVFKNNTVKSKDVNGTTVYYIELVSAT